MKRRLGRRDGRAASAAVWRSLRRHALASMITAGLLSSMCAWGLGDVEETNRAALSSGPPTMVLDDWVPEDGT